MLPCSDPPTTTTNIGNSTEKDKDKNIIRLRMSTNLRNKKHQFGPVIRVRFFNDSSQELYPTAETPRVDLDLINSGYSLICS